MDLPVLQIETNLIEFRHANRTCQDYVYIYILYILYIYIYVFLLIFGIYIIIYIYSIYTSKTTDRNDGEKWLNIKHITSPYIYVYIYRRKFRSQTSDNMER